MKYIPLVKFRPDRLLETLVFRAQHLYKIHISNREQKVSYGTENPDKKFYVIYVKSEILGLFRLVIIILSHIIYAISRGLVPVVDLQNHQNQYLKSDLLGKENAWEYFFEQPCGIYLQDISRSKNIILSNQYHAHFPLGYELTSELFTEPRNAKRLQYFKEAFQKYIRFNQAISVYIQRDYENILQGKGRVLGVLARGTDYVHKKHPEHAIQPKPQEMITKAMEVMHKQKCEYLYLATEDQEIYKKFKDCFGNRLLTNAQPRYMRRDIENVRWLSESDSQNDKYAVACSYLSSIYLLSKCNCFIGGNVSGTVGVYLLTNGFDYDYVWDIGMYS